MLTFSIIGLGNRGSVYADNLIKQKDVKIVSVCDTDIKSLKKAQEVYGVAAENTFLNENEFFAAKRADVLLIATLDGLHCRQAVRGMQLGYDVLLEKPVAPNLAEVNEIYSAAQKYGREVVICHNLRYTPFYQKIKLLIAGGRIGKVVGVEQSENVAYHHYMCSFIRGKWHKSAQTSSIILQKCCHDLDIISWLIGGAEVESVQSFGGLNYYAAENKPAGAADRCMQCGFKDCRYNAFGFYKKAPEALVVPYGFEPTDENLASYLNEPDNLYGQCVFACDNDVCDRQTVEIKFKNGATASLIMHGFAAGQTDRYTRVYGEKGVICGDLGSGTLSVESFDGTIEFIDVNADISGNDAHNGGDAKLIADYVEFKTGKTRPLGISKLEDSLQSHRLAFAAEELRVENAKNSQNSCDSCGECGKNLPVKGLASGVYAEVLRLKNQELGAMQAVIGTNVVKTGELKTAAGKTLTFVCELAGAKIQNYCVNMAKQPYAHGFIDLYFENGVAARCAFAEAAELRKSELRAYGVNAEVFADFNNGALRLLKAKLFDKSSEIACEKLGDYSADLSEDVKKILSEI